MKNIKIKIHSLTLILILCSLLCGYIKYTLILIQIILFHELGHVFISLLLGYKILSIDIYPFGGVTKIDKHLNNSIFKDFLIAIFGIIFQFILFLFFKNEYFIKMNIYLIIFNLLPIIPLDGSKILMEVLSLFLPYKKVLKILPIISFYLIIIFFLFNIKYNLDNYLIIALLLTKTYENYKLKEIFYEKFLLERSLYDIDYYYIKNNININKYKKDTKYYYLYNNKLISDKELLQIKYRQN